MKSRPNIIFWIILLFLGLALFNLFRGELPDAARERMSYTEFLAAVDGNRISAVTLRGNSISGHLNDGRAFQTYAPDDPGLIPRLTASGVAIEARPSEGGNPLLSIFISWFPMLLLIGIWIFFLRQMQSGGGRALGFGKSRARLLNERTGRVTFADVAGIEEAKEELEEVVDFLRDPQKFQRLGGRIPKGVLLVGPPGTGKTLLARAIAGEAGVPFFTISGSDFVEMFVGVGASRVRDMFEQGKKSAPCIIFVDEIDAVGRHRGAGLGGGNDEREQTLNQLLVEMDGFEANEGVILIAATNRPDVLDPALLCVRDGLTVRWSCQTPILTDAKKSCGCIPAKCLWLRMWSYGSWRVAHQAFQAQTLPILPTKPLCWQHGRGNAMSPKPTLNAPKIRC